MDIYNRGRGCFYRIKSLLLESSSEKVKGATESHQLIYSDDDDATRKKKKKMKKKKGEKRDMVFGRRDCVWSGGVLLL